VYFVSYRIFFYYSEVVYNISFIERNYGAKARVVWSEKQTNVTQQHRRTQKFRLGVQSVVCDRGAEGAKRPSARPKAVRGVGAEGGRPSHHGGPGV
jgi:hypothetical protein